MLPSATRNEAYEKAGFYIAEHSDVMIAVWDGQASQGRGGTAEIVAKARFWRKPVARSQRDTINRIARKCTMPPTSQLGQREIRVFRDMQEEREELFKQIFPQLRCLEESGVSGGEVDLSWSVPDEAKVRPLCLGWGL